MLHIPYTQEKLNNSNNEIFSMENSISSQLDFLPIDNYFAKESSNDYFQKEFFSDIRDNFTQVPLDSLMHSNFINFQQDSWQNLNFISFGLISID